MADQKSNEVITLGTLSALTEALEVAVKAQRPWWVKGAAVAAAAFFILFGVLFIGFFFFPIRESVADSYPWAMGFLFLCFLACSFSAWGEK